MVFNIYSPKRNLTIKRTEDFQTAYEIAVEPANKAVSHTTDGFFRYILNATHRSGASSLFELDRIERLVSNGCGFKKFSPFFETFNDKIGQYIAAGFAQGLEELVSPPPMKRKNDDIGPQVLTMEHLGLGFIACLLPLTLAIAVFCSELLVHRLNSKLRQLSKPKLDQSRNRPKSNRKTATKKQITLRNKIRREMKPRKASAKSFVAKGDGNCAKSLPISMMKLDQMDFSMDYLYQLTGSARTVNDRDPRSSNQSTQQRSELTGQLWAEELFGELILEATEKAFSESN